MTPLIQLSEVSKVYRSRGVTVTALRDISLPIDAGASVAVVGESGSGKTTLARVLLAQVRSTTGSYTYEGREVAALRGAALREWRRNVQAVLQNPRASFSPRSRVAVLATEPLEAASPGRLRDRADRAAGLLEMVGLDASLVRRYPHQLSGGQCQRIAIARALSSSPQLIVLDEPLSALDVSVKVQIIELLRRLRAELGTTYVYVTHDFASVPQLSTDVYVMYAGRIMERLPVERLQGGVDHPYTRLLLASVPSIKTRKSFDLPQAADAPHQQTVTQGCAFAGRCPIAVARCHVEEPELRQLGPRWASRCHFAGEDKTGEDKA